MELYQLLDYQWNYTGQLYLLTRCNTSWATGHLDLQWRSYLYFMRKTHVENYTTMLLWKTTLLCHGKLHYFVMENYNTTGYGKLHYHVMENYTTMLWKTTLLCSVWLDQNLYFMTSHSWPCYSENFVFFTTCKTWYQHYMSPWIKIDTLIEYIQCKGCQHENRWEWYKET